MQSMSSNICEIFVSPLLSTKPDCVSISLFSNNKEKQQILCHTGHTKTTTAAVRSSQIKSSQVKENYLYSAILVCHIHKALRHGSHSFTCKLHHTCLSFVSVHQMAPPLTEVADIQLQLTVHLSTPKGRKAELVWLVDLQRTVYPHKWSPVSYRSSAGQGSSPAKDRRSTAVPSNHFSRITQGMTTYRLR